MSGLVSYGAYLPYWRLERGAIRSSLGSGGGSGRRSVASYDEDTTSMGVEAGRLALAAAPGGYEPGLLAFATAAPAYADKTNATAIHAALAIPATCPAFDAAGAVRSGMGAAWMAQAAGGLAVLSDIRTGRPGSADEAAGGDGAVALAFGRDGVIAEVVGAASMTAEFTDRWRAPGDSWSQQWEERFGEHVYVPLAEQAVDEMAKTTGVAMADVDHVIVTGPHGRAVKAAARSIGARPDAVADDLGAEVGNTGTAHWALLLADVLDRAGADEHIAVVLLADGCDVWLLRTTAALATRRPATTVRQRIRATRSDLGYAQFLTWRGFLQREPPRRPEPDRPAAPPAARTDDWKFAFVGSRDETGFVHLPPSRVSMGTGEIDRMEPVAMADVRATVATFTVDRLAYSLSPPVVAAVIDFDPVDGGAAGARSSGRFQCELTDVDPDAVAIGDRVEMTFRRLYTTGGIHNYFWKARPLRQEED